MISKVILAIGFLAVSAVAKNDSDPIEGSFNLEKLDELKSPDMAKVLHFMDIAPSDIEKVQKASKVNIFVRKQDSGYQYSIKGLVGDVEMARSFDNGKEFQDKRFDGKAYKGKITVIGRAGIREADFGSFKTLDIAAFLPEYLDILFTVEKGAEFGKARLEFKRVSAPGNTIK